MNDGQIRVELQESMGSDASIANAAWTSTYDKARREDKYDDPAKVEALVYRLATDGHQVPFESVVFRFWMRIPIFVDRQLMTHRMASHNGLSGRYRTVPSDFYEIPDDIRAILERPRVGMGEAIEIFETTLESQHHFYSSLVADLKLHRDAGTVTDAEFKRCREVFRGVIGTAFMVERTSMYNLVSFANLQRLRNSEHAQPETRRVAELMLAAALEAKAAPVALTILGELGWTMGKPNHEWRVGVRS